MKTWRRDPKPIIPALGEGLIYVLCTFDNSTFKEQSIIIVGQIYHYEALAS